MVLVCSQLCTSRRLDGKINVGTLLVFPHFSHFLNCSFHQNFMICLFMLFYFCSFLHLVMKPTKSFLPVSSNLLINSGDKEEWLWISEGI